MNKEVEGVGKNRKEGKRRVGVATGLGFPLCLGVCIQKNMGTLGGPSLQYKVPGVW